MVCFSVPSQRQGEGGAGNGRGGMPSVFDGLAMEHDVTRLKLIDVKKFDSDAVQIRYQC